MRENQSQTREIVLQLDGIKTREVVKRLQKDLGSTETDLATLLTRLCTTDDRNFMELFTANYGYPDGDLAGIYGVKAPPREFERTPFPAGSERAGILGQALFLAVTAKPEDRIAGLRAARARREEEPPKARRSVQSELPET